MEANTTITDADNSTNTPDRLAKRLEITRTWSDDHDAQLAALRVVLGLPARAVIFSEEEAA
jgi:hypothetical protein